MDMFCVVVKGCNWYVYTCSYFPLFKAVIRLVTTCTAYVQVILGLVWLHLLVGGTAGHCVDLYDFCILQGSVATILRWGGPNYCHLCQVSLWCCMPKIIKIGQCVTELLKKYHWHSFFLRHSVMLKMSCSVDKITLLQF